MQPDRSRTDSDPIDIPGQRDMYDDRIVVGGPLCSGDAWNNALAPRTFESPSSKSFSPLSNTASSTQSPQSLFQPAKQAQMSPLLLERKEKRIAFENAEKWALLREKERPYMNTALQDERYVGIPIPTPRGQSKLKAIQRELADLKEQLQNCLEKEKEFPLETPRFKKMAEEILLKINETTAKQEQLLKELRNGDYYNVEDPFAPKRAGLYF